MTRAALPAAARRSSLSPRCCAPTALRSRRSRPTTFLSAIDLLGPRSLDDIRRAAHATLAPPPERHEEFDALFDAHFLGAVELGRETAEPDRRHARCQEDRARRLRAARIRRHQRGRPGRRPPPKRCLRAASAAADETDTLRRFQRALPERLPQRRGYRRVAGQARPRPRSAPRHAGSDPQRRRGLPPAAPACAASAAARILLLIDVSGSMKERTDAHLRFAHALVRAADRIEVFTIGTRLTRVTRRAAAQEPRAGAGHRLRPRLRLGRRHAHRRCPAGLPRRAALCRLRARRRGAVLSDGLERGDPQGHDRRGQAPRRARLAPLLADAARRRARLPARDRGAEIDPAASRRAGRRRLRRSASCPQPRAAEGGPVIHAREQPSCSGRVSHFERKATALSAACVMSKLPRHSRCENDSN